MPSKKTHYRRWRDKCVEYIKENGASFTRTLWLSAGVHKSKPKNVMSATQILMRDDRFIGEYEDRGSIHEMGKWQAKQKIWRLTHEE